MLKKININIKYHKTIIISTLVFIIGFFFVNLINYSTGEDAFRRNLFNSVLPSSSGNIFNCIEEFNSKYILAVEFISCSPVFEDLIKRSTVYDNREEFISYLSSMKLSEDIKTSGLVSLATGRYYDSEGVVLDIDTESDRDRWIKEFVEADYDFKLTFYDPENDKDLFALYYDTKLRDYNGDVFAVFGIGVSFESILKKAENIGQGKKFYFINGKGEYRFPVALRGNNIYDRYNLRFENIHLSESRIDQYERFVQTEEDGRDIVFYIRYLPSLDTFLVVEDDITPLLYGLRKHLLSSFLSGLFLSLFIVILNIIIIHRSNKVLAGRGYTDPLTGSYNRRFLESLFTSGLGISNRPGNPLSLIVVDIDYFKKINDTRGHLEGDRILKAVSDTARSYIRDKDFVIRWGGDEFVILVFADIEHAGYIAERIREEVEINSYVTITAGISEKDENESFDCALSRADFALYNAKKEGRNRVYTA